MFIFFGGGVPRSKNLKTSLSTSKEKIEQKHINVGEEQTSSAQFLC
jgi:hypothetical protein